MTCCAKTSPTNKSLVSYQVPSTCFTVALPAASTLASKSYDTVEVVFSDDDDGEEAIFKFFTGNVTMVGFLLTSFVN